MGRAGITTGYQHRCRRQGCSHREAAADAVLRRCPVDGRKLWPVPRVPPLRFHDLRHTTASLLLMAGADAVAVQKLLRHGDLRTTVGTYGHLAAGYLRSEVDRLSFLPVTPEIDGGGEVVPALAAREETAPRGPYGVHGGEEEGQPPRPAGAVPVEAWALARARDTGLEPVAFGSGGSTGDRPSPSVLVQPLTNTQGGMDASGHSGRQKTPRTTFLFTRCSPRAGDSAFDGGGPRKGRGRLCLVPEGQVGLLSIREAARMLGIAAVTLYAICGRGELAHVRVSNAIRLRPEDLEAYLARRRPRT
jgi:excisionase family DNA binding protein